MVHIVVPAPLSHCLKAQFSFRLARTLTITSNPLVESHELRGAVVECT
jgi:hypothetical protein